MCIRDRNNSSIIVCVGSSFSIRDLRSNFTQSITDHENSQQHINSALSYNNWFQGNTIDIYLESEINSKFAFWRNVLHRLINVIITLASCNLLLRGHDSKSGNFMSILHLLSNYEDVYKRQT